jgi:type III pantothenate kinase
MTEKKVRLLIDIGNSNTLIAEYLQTKINNIKTVTTDYFANNLNEFQLSSYEKIIISSVVPDIDKRLKPLSKCVFIDHQTIPKIKINLEKPEETGADRLVNALAAHVLYEKSCLIVDSGTAITFCCVNKDGVYEGGAIFPGMKIASKALELYTAKIPLISVTPIKKIIGKSTKEAVQAGLYHGYINLINGMINKYKTVYPDIFVIGTGNGLEVLKDELILDIYEPQLILKGLGICADLST